MNLRPSGYEPDELPDCSTPHLRAGIVQKAPEAAQAGDPIRGQPCAEPAAWNPEMAVERLHLVVFARIFQARLLTQYVAPSE